MINGLIKALEKFIAAMDRQRELEIEAAQDTIDAGEELRELLERLKNEDT